MVKLTGALLTTLIENIDEAVYTTKRVKFANNALYTN